MSKASYTIPAEETRRELEVLKSRFIATLAPALSNEEARAFIKRIRDEFPEASHHVPAYIIGGGNNFSEYCSDDGEPQGTAGRPTLTVLRGSGLGDAALVITRYFGGTLLGTGGLVKAYTEAAQLVINAARRAQKVEVHTVLLAIPYNLLERIRLIAPRHNGEILDEEFAADITLSLRFPIDSLDGFQRDLQELSAGKLQAEIIETGEMLVAISPG
ncbi:MAG: YigZ family protein [Chloroflexi bacterium HGW-Chloroflexi-6]|nr:MAG: YigZ family protein [Chloroflexi bacterium HGW-Chloroflexi-6]